MGDSETRRTPVAPRDAGSRAAAPFGVGTRDVAAPDGVRQDAASSDAATHEAVPRGGARELRRRDLLRGLAVAGAGTTVFGRALAALADGPDVTAEMVKRAAWVSGLELTPEESEMMREALPDLLDGLDAIRAVPLSNDVPPAVRFDAQPGHVVRRVARTDRGAPFPTWGRGSDDAPPGDAEDVAYADLGSLARWIAKREIGSTDLTRICLERLEAHDPTLQCVITTLAERALASADAADKDLARGVLRSPLHGIPWGAKDLLAVSGAPTTWGAAPYREQTIDATATVVRKLDEAGAVLTAKLTLGALAMGDVWYDGTTRNPWHAVQGSSGSSAGSASAVAAGLVPFAIGSETYGSIASPCTRCGVTGLRPTFGRVSRHGAMALSWTMDKIGPIARSVEACARVLRAIEGPDGLDPTVVGEDRLGWTSRPLAGIRVGCTFDLFEANENLPGNQRSEVREAWAKHDRAVLRVLEDLGVELVPVTLPEPFDPNDARFLLIVEAAAAFDALTRSGKDDELVRQGPQAWPNLFRTAQLVPAVEYVRAQRLRTLLMRAYEEMFESVDVYVTPTYGGSGLLATNLTGHPQVILPNGFLPTTGAPTSISFVGRLFGEAELVKVAAAYQRATDFHLARPDLEAAAAARRDEA